MNTESLSLKWGTLKAWNLKTEASKEALRKYGSVGTVSLSAMAQHDTDEQKAALCELIDAVDCDTIWLDWDSISVTKDKAKRYVLTYGNQQSEAVEPVSEAACQE
jgi:hypothetical protein